MSESSGDQPLPADFSLATLGAAYRDGGLTPSELAHLVIERAVACPDPAVWITLRPVADLLADAKRIETELSPDLPLWGIPFAVKDNIDVAGLPTTAACLEFEHIAEETALVVQRLVAAGALLVGKTNLDQFATGLVGLRSPYGYPRCPFDNRYISGGSSSGSAVAVSRGLVSFALGTDTAGSGRVPAAFNNLVGLKPSKGLISMAGVLPACRSLDCVSIFALAADEAAAVLAVAADFDAVDPFARPAPWDLAAPLPEAPAHFRFGLPRTLEFFGDAEAARLFSETVARLQSLGGTPVELDMTPFSEVARLLYEGPWVAERTAAVGDFLAARLDAGHPVVRRIIEGGRRFTAADAFQASYRLADLRRICDEAWQEVAVILTPTAPTIYQVAEVLAEPLKLNSRLGHYTNFVNLLDYAAVALPAGFRPNGLPFGVTLVGPAFSDAALLSLADRLHRAAGLSAGATGLPLPPRGPRAAVAETGITFAVLGAHMRGLPLSGEMAALGGQFVEAATTAPAYRLYDLATEPPRPGLVRSQEGGPIAVELWRLPDDAFGRFTAAIAAPLGIGRIQLADGRDVPGFLCEAIATEDKRDITAFGGWRAYRESGAPDLEA